MEGSGGEVEGGEMEGAEVEGGKVEGGEVERGEMEGGEMEGRELGRERMKGEGRWKRKTKTSGGEERRDGRGPIE